MPSILDQLKDMTTVVADTGDFVAVRTYNPVDCTTNPSLVLAAFQSDSAQDLIARELEECRKAGKTAEETAATLTVAIGAELSTLVPGRVSTEVDACLSFDVDASVQRARDIVVDYAQRGVGKDRILIKLAATWEGIRAAEILQAEGIDCNLTLIFSLIQAVACAEANAYLISPFVGRITDWYKKAEGVEAYPPEIDPGVMSVRSIYEYYKANGIDTIVMGASFRTKEQVLALAGFDNLTISPVLLDQLSHMEGSLDRMLSPDSAAEVARMNADEASFRWHLNADAMATEKLSEGIRNFDKDHQKLIAMVADQL